MKTVVRVSGAGNRTNYEQLPELVNKAGTGIDLKKLVNGIEGREEWLSDYLTHTACNDVDPVDFDEGDVMLSYLAEAGEGGEVIIDNGEVHIFTSEEVNNVKSFDTGDNWFYFVDRGDEEYTRTHTPENVLSAIREQDLGSLMGWEIKDRMGNGGFYVTNIRGERVFWVEYGHAENPEDYDIYKKMLDEIRSKVTDVELYYNCLEELQDELGSDFDQDGNEWNATISDEACAYDLGWDMHIVFVK